MIPGASKRVLDVLVVVRRKNAHSATQQVIETSKSHSTKMCWQPFVDLIISKVSTHLYNVLNWSDRQKVISKNAKTRLATHITQKQIGNPTTC